MHSPATAIAWEFRQRHRWGLLAIAAYLIALMAIRLIAGTQRVDLEEQTFAFMIIVPMTAAFFYLMAMFTFGLSGDIAARQSMYPARMFTLPVTADALAGWPMLYGAIAMALLWAATRLLAVWPTGVDVPALWPLLFGPALLAWTQALTWLPYPLRGLRVIVTVLWLMVIDTVILVALELKASEGVMIALLAPHVPLAYLVARFAVARARRGDVPDWRDVLAPLVRIAERLRRRGGHFASAPRAQEWLEWREHGRSLPALVAILLPFQLAMLFPFREVPAIVVETLGMVLMTPPFMAVFVAATVSRSGAAYGVAPFIATRPLSNASLVAAKLKTSIRSTLAAWLLVLIAIPIALRLSGTAAMVSGWAREAVRVFGLPRAIALASLVLVMLVLATWKQLVQSLCVGMSGREWLIKGSVFAALALLAVAFPLGFWILGNRAAIAWLMDAFPAIAAALICIKLAAAAWIAVRLHDRGLLADRALFTGAIAFNAGVFALYALLAWIFPAIVVPRYILALVAILTVPLARLGAAPLALAWNRHRP